MRVAVATAKLLAQALAVPTSASTPWRSTPRPGAAAACSSARSSARPAARSAPPSGAPAETVELLEEARLAAPDDLLVPPEEPTVFVGELEPLWRQRIAALGARAILASPAQSIRRAALLAEIAAERLARGEHDPITTLAPLYIRPPRHHRATPLRSPCRTTFSRCS